MLNIDKTQEISERYQRAISYSNILHIPERDDWVYIGEERISIKGLRSVIVCRTKFQTKFGDNTATAAVTPIIVDGKTVYLLRSFCVAVYQEEVFPTVEAAVESASLRLHARIESEKMMFSSLSINLIN